MALDGKNKILVNTLQDIGATESLIVESMLPFLTDTTTGGKSPVLGIWLVPLWVPLHHFQLFHDLLCGEVEMGVCPQLPVQGVDIILGNDLAGARVWKDCVWVHPYRNLRNQMSLRKNILKLFLPVL